MKIVSGAFAHSGKICTVVFPESLNSIDSLAFYRCGGLQKVVLPIPPIDIQHRIAKILDSFETLVNDLTAGLPAEIEARRKQYEYYRNKLLTFKKIA